VNVMATFEQGQVESFSRSAKVHIYNPYMSDRDAKVDAVVGCIAGLSFAQLAPWIGSLEASGFRGRKIVIYLYVHDDTLAELRERGFEIYDAAPLHGEAHRNLRRNSDPEEISVNRFFYIWHFLSQVAPEPQIRNVISTDASDVIFQRNPTDWLEKHLGQKKLVVGSESLRFEDEPWGASTMMECFGSRVWEAYRRNLIYNAGSFAGEYRTVIDLALQMYLLAPGDRVLYSDQQALNLLLGSKIYQDVTLFASPEDGWACQAGTMADPILLKTVRAQLLTSEPRFDGEIVRTSAGEAFTIVHQYNRVPAWNNRLKEKYATPPRRPSRMKVASWWQRLMPRWPR
jgi:hypothetical protein